MKKYVASYECPVIELDGESAGGTKGYIEIQNLPEDIVDEDWSEWLRRQLASICCIMVSGDVYILDDDNEIVTIHDYLMILNRRYREKIQGATNRMTSSLGSMN